MNVWVFGYGSLIWRPDFPYLASQRATLPGFSRRFWQGSHDHRGVPESPGRVVTLIPDASAMCAGVAYLIDSAVVTATFEQLDYREKNGYQRIETELHLDDEQTVPGLVYVAPLNNFAYLGEAPLQDMARQILHSKGPSGRNVDYLTSLADALRELGAHDPHVFELEQAVKQLMPDTDL